MAEGIQLINAKISSDATFNANKYSHGDIIKLNVILTYRNYGTAITVNNSDSFNISCSYDQGYKNTDLNTWVVSNKTQSVHINEPSFPITFVANQTGVLYDPNNLTNLTNDTDVIIKGYIDVVLENPEFGNTFKFQFSVDSQNSVSGYYTYNITPDRIVSFNDNEGNKFNVKTEVDSVYRNGVSIKDYIPYRFNYVRKCNYSPTLKKDDCTYESGHILEIDNKEGIAIPNGPFIAIFNCDNPIKVTETLNFTFGPDGNEGNSVITKAFNGSSDFCSNLYFQQACGLVYYAEATTIFKANTEAMVLVDPRSNSFTSMYPINSKIPDYEAHLKLEIVANQDDVSFNAIQIPGHLSITLETTVFGLIKNDIEEGDGGSNIITLKKSGDYYDLRYGYIYANSENTEFYTSNYSSVGTSENNTIWDTLSRVYYKRKYETGLEALYAASLALSDFSIYLHGEEINSQVSIRSSILFLPLSINRFNYTGLYNLFVQQYLDL